MEDKGQALGWDDEGQVQESSYDVLPEGEYTYEVVNFKREHFGGSAKMSACPVAALQLKCTNVENGMTVTGFCRLYLNSKVQWRISNFFKSCGLLDPNAAEGASMPMSLFGQVVGCTGRVKVKVTKSTNNGKTYENNDFNFVPRKAGTAPAAPAQQQSWGGKNF
jgi:hypothetical protein